jgi:hypothetical protein
MWYNKKTKLKRRCHMQLFLNQPFVPQGNVVSQKAVGTNSTTAHIYTIQGKTFQYKVFTDANNNITKVIAISSRELAPVSYFIQNPQNCQKQLITRIPLRMASYEYTCPTGTYKYTTFGTIGFLTTTAEVVR